MEATILTSGKHAYIMLTLLNPTFSLNSTREDNTMDTIEVPQVCTLVLNNLPIVGRPIWRLTEGKHIVKLEITWQLPITQTSAANQPTQKYCETTCQWCDWWCDQDGGQDGGKENGGAHANDGG